MQIVCLYATYANSMLVCHICKLYACMTHMQIVCLYDTYANCMLVWHICKLYAGMTHMQIVCLYSNYMFVCKLHACISNEAIDSRAVSQRSTTFFFENIDKCNFQTCSAWRSTWPRRWRVAECKSNPINTRSRWKWFDRTPCSHLPRSSRTCCCRATCLSCLSSSFQRGRRNERRRNTSGARCGLALRSKVKGQRVSHFSMMTQTQEKGADFHLKFTKSVNNLLRASNDFRNNKYFAFKATRLSTNSTL